MERNKRIPVKDTLDARIVELARRARIGSWAQLTEEVSIPTEFAAALATGRTELLNIAQPRELSKDECARLYNLIRVLIETNMALQEHASDTAKLATNFLSTIGGVLSTANQIVKFAQFRHDQIDEPEEEQERA